MLHRCLWWEAWEAPTDALLFQHGGASYSCSQQQVTGSPGEHPEKEDVLEVWVNLPVAAGPECTQKSSSESQVAVRVSFICEPLVLLAACTLFQQHFFPVTGGRECLSKLAEWTKQCDGNTLNKHFKQDSEVSQAKLLKLKHTVQPLPLPLLSLYHLGAIGSSNVGRNTLVCHQLFPMICAWFWLSWIWLHIGFSSKWNTYSEDSLSKDHVLFSR